MSNILDLSKITNKNRFSSTFLVAGLIVAGVVLICMSGNEINIQSVTGCILTIISVLLIIDAYYKNSIKEHYEDIISNLNKMLSDSRAENRKNSKLINERMSTGQNQVHKENTEYQNLME